MTIASEIQRIQTNIANAYDVLEEKGATIPATKNVANLADCILTIPVGPSKPYLVIPADDQGQYGGPYIYSSDGINWTELMISAKSLQEASYVGEKYFLLGNSNSSWAPYVGEDPTNSSSFIKPANTYFVDEVAFGNGIYVGMYSGNRNTFSISSDAINWTTYTDRLPQGHTYPTSIAFGNGVFVINLNEYGSGGLYYSSDGINWTKSLNAVSQERKSLIFDGTQFVFYGQSQLWISSDGINWTQKIHPGYWGCIAYCNGVYTTGNTNDRVTFTSTDLTNWTTITTNVTYGSRVFSDGKAFYKCYGSGNFNYIQTSTDGINWTNITVPSSKRWMLGC